MAWKAYAGRGLLLVGMLVSSAYAQEAEAGERPRRTVTYVTKFPDGTVHVGRDNRFRSYQRNVTHNYQSLRRRLEREELELRNRLTGRPNPSPIQIKVKIR